MKRFILTVSVDEGLQDKLINMIRKFNAVNSAKDECDVVIIENAVEREYKDDAGET